MCYCRPVTVFIIAIGQSNLIIQKMGFDLVYEIVLTMALY